MKQSLTLTELAVRLDGIKNATADFVGPSKDLYMHPDGRLEMRGTGEVYDVAPGAERQMTQWAKIPSQYADRCPADLVAINMNHWFANLNADRMVRTLNPSEVLGIDQPTVRSFNSDKFRQIDGYDAAQASLPTIVDAGNVKIESCDIDVYGNKLYIKAVVEGQDVEIMPEGAMWGRGHQTAYVVKPAIVIENSDTGKSSYKVSPGIYQSACTNLLISNTHAFRKFHVGKSQSDGEMWEILSQETQQLSNQALLAQITDLTKAAIDGTSVVFQAQIDELREKAGIQVVKPEATMKAIGDQFSLTQDETDGILGNLIRGGDLSAYGVQAAVTLHAQDDGLNYERATELERIGGKLIELPSSDWDQILAAAA